MQHKRHLARTCRLVALVLATGTGHVHAGAIALPTGNPSTGIYTPAQVVTGLTQHRHAWVGRTVRVALPVESMDWGRGSSYGLGAYQLSVQLSALPRGVNESGDPFNVLVSDQQMRAARHAARVARPHPARGDGSADRPSTRPRHADRRSALGRRRDVQRVRASMASLQQNRENPR